MTDQALDVLVEPDGTWRWKDEDDLAEAQALGHLDCRRGSGRRAEGERVIAASPWPTGWEDWRPERRLARDVARPRLARDRMRLSGARRPSSSGTRRERPPEIPATTARRLRIPGDADWQLPRARQPAQSLGLVRLGSRWSLWHECDATGAFSHWYVNFERDQRRTPIGIDFVDEKLDFVGSPDGAVRWKDEDELVEAARTGYLDEADVRAQAAKVLADRPVADAAGMGSSCRDPAPDAGDGPQTTGRRRRSSDGRRDRPQQPRTIVPQGLRALDDGRNRRDRLRDAARDAGSSTLDLLPPRLASGSGTRPPHRRRRRAAPIHTAGIIPSTND